MSGLIELLNVAVESKPKFGDACNHCGYCCLTEICSVGLEYTDKTIGPCPHLVGEDPEKKHYNQTKHYCNLIIKLPELKKVIGAGSGCCAKTQAEVIEELGGFQK